MPENIIIHKEAGFIEVFSYGKVTLEMMNFSLGKVTELVRGMGLRGLLVDTTDQETMPGTIKTYSFATNLPRSFKIAVVVSEEQPTLEDLHFFETVARNRALMVKNFFSREKAIAWIAR